MPYGNTGPCQREKSFTFSRLATFPCTTLLYPAPLAFEAMVFIGRLSLIQDRSASWPLVRPSVRMDCDISLLRAIWFSLPGCAEDTDTPGPVSPPVHSSSSALGPAFSSFSAPVAPHPGPPTFF